MKPFDFQHNNKQRCANTSCSLEIYAGSQAIAVQRVLKVGPKKHVPLEESPLLFHDIKCLKQFFCDCSDEKPPAKDTERQTRLDEFK